MKTKHFGPFRLYCGRTRWNEKTIAIGFGRAHYMGTNEWLFPFMGLVLWAVYINIGIAWKDR